MRDPKGKPIVANFVRELDKSPQGWVHYQWPRPDGQVFYWKTSHVRRATDPNGQTLIVGSGRYQMRMEPFFVVEQVDDAVELIRKLGTEKAFATLRDKSSGFLFYSAYVFVIDEKGTLLVNNAFPENEGKDVSDLSDIDGKTFVREMLAVPPDGSAWIDYKWPRPGDTRPSAKSSFVRNVEIDGQKLLVGSGVYFGVEPEVRELPAE
jgi:signal transduction histidine kinase